MIYPVQNSVAHVTKQFTKHGTFVSDLEMAGNQTKPLKMPANLNSHQVLHLSELMHKAVSAFIAPKLDQPLYQTLDLLLSQAKQSIDKLCEAQISRKYKHPTDMRLVGGADGEGDSGRQKLGAVSAMATMSALGNMSCSQKKRTLYRTRRKQMIRFRTLVKWHYEGYLELADERNVMPQDIPAEALSPEHTAARKLADILNLRIDHFEKSGYSESSVEFQHFFDAIDGDLAAIAALKTLGLERVYEKIVENHRRFADEIVRHAAIQADNETKPKITASKHELRLAMNLVLSQLHILDVSGVTRHHGEISLGILLGQLAELLMKERSLAKRRVTLKSLRKMRQIREVVALNTGLGETLVASVEGSDIEAFEQPDTQPDTQSNTQLETQSRQLQAASPD